MRMNDRGHFSTDGAKQLFNVSFHDFAEREQNTTTLELASEFGISLQDVKKLKQHLGRR
ncbi:hypothetical protein [Ectobacillus ponti]|uniref:RNA polymerase subunit sigma-70 n=1 Tax=Ectobacillus ponti TaxID=2961894 RepID=A0AA41X204_9BACI|nr:hypothetical protein [Ectobacillus ponti]MCP8967282.1 hypothetical protein [Ectobacillus ponti]